MCGQDNCVNGCSSKKKRALQALAAPAANLDPRITDIPLPVISKRQDPVWGSLNKPAAGGLDNWIEVVFGTSSGGNLYIMPDTPTYGASDSYFLPFTSPAPPTAQSFVAQYGLIGCTSVVIVSHQGVLMVRTQKYEHGI